MIDEREVRLWTDLGDEVGGADERETDEADERDDVFLVCVGWVLSQPLPRHHEDVDLTKL